MSVLHITCKHWLGHVTVNKRAGDGVLKRFLSNEIDCDITLILPVGLYIVEQSWVDGRVAQSYSVIVSADSVSNLEIAWQNSNIATLADQQKVQYDGVSAGLHYAFGIKHGNCFLGDVRQDLPLLDSIMLGTDVPFVLLSAVVGENGDTLSLTFSKNAYRGTAYTPTSLNVDTVNNNDIQLSYISGEGTPTLNFTLSSIIQINEAVDFDFDGFPDCLVDEIDISLVEITDFQVVNESTQSFSDLALWDSFDGVIDGSTYTATNHDYPSFHTGTIAAGSSLSNAIKAVGSHSLRLDGRSNILSSNMPSVSAYKGRCGLWVRLDTDIYGGFHSLLRLSAASDAHSLTLTCVNGTQLIVGITNNGVTLIPATTVTPYYAISTNTWFFIELIWNFETVGLIIRINGDDDHTTVIQKIANAPIPYIRYLLGISNYYGYVDNLIISTDPNRDLYALSLLEACPRI